MEDNNYLGCEMKVTKGEAGYVLEDVPHLTDYIHDLPTYPNPLRSNPAYSVVKQYFVDADDTVPEKVVVHKEGPRGIHFRRAGPRQRVYFAPDEVHAAIVTCGGLCPGLNTVIREIVCALYHMYGVTKVLGIDVRLFILYITSSTSDKTLRFDYTIHWKNMHR
ncbi:ATP-dependent 6-phosphofructokinase 6-like protein [Tanacetum coccineum]